MRDTRLASSDSALVRDREARLVSELLQCITRNPIGTTPYRVYLPHTAFERFAAADALVRRVSQASGLAVRIAYSVKTNPYPPLVRLAAVQSFFADVSSGGELRHVQRSGFDATSVVCNGPIPPPVVSDGKYHAVFADSLEALDRNRRLGVPMSVAGVRMRAEVPSVTWESRFGVPLRTGRERAQVAARLRAHADDGCEIGLSTHLASSRHGVPVWWSAADSLREMACTLADTIGAGIAVLDLGGGWTVDYFSGLFEEDLVRFCRECKRTVPALSEVILEPGRALVEDSMAIITQVIERRRGQAADVAVVDASIAELSEAGEYPHRLLAIRRQGEATELRPGPDVVLGRLPSERDRLRTGIELPPELDAGDLLAILDAGAYDCSMAFPFGAGRAAGSCALPPSANGTARSRFDVTTVAVSGSDDEADLRAGLTSTPKSIPHRFFYDDEGSRLFDELSRQPEYYQMRLERAILSNSARDVSALAEGCELVELGSGTSERTPLLLRAIGSDRTELSYHAIDVNRTVLTEAGRRLTAEFPSLTMRGWQGTFEQVLPVLPTATRRRLVIILGGTIGNLDGVELTRLLSCIRTVAQAGDLLLVGADFEKDSDVLEAAYNDVNGIAARLSRNVLRHLNRRYEANFELDHFRHVAEYNPAAGQIEAYLVSSTDQTVLVGDLDLTIALSAEERIRIAVARKWRRGELETVFAQCGLGMLARWTDPQAWYGVFVCSTA